MIVLGIDPGSTRIGYGLIEKNKGVLVFKKTGVIEIAAQDAGIKLIKLASELKKILAESKPDVIGIEKIFFTKNIKTGIAVAEARGVIMLTAAASGAHIMEFTPQEVKQAVTNYGGAGKKAVARMVSLLLGIPPLNILDDATDALAIAITATHRHRT